MRRPLLTLLAAVAALLVTAAPTLACGGLIGSERGRQPAPHHDASPATTTAWSTTSPASSSPAAAARSARSLRCRASRPTSCAAATGRSSASSSRPIRRTSEAAFRRWPARPSAGGDEAEVLLETTHRRARHHHPARRRRRGRPVGEEPRLPPPARCARGARLLRRAQPDLHGRRLRRRCGRGARPGDRRRHAGAPDDPDRQPVGAAAHPGPRQGRRRDSCEADVYLLTDERPALLPNAGAFAESAGWTSTTAPRRRDAAAGRPAIRRRHGVGARRGVAHEGGRRHDGR